MCFSSGPDLLDLLLMASEGKNETQKLTDDEVFDEALTFGKFFFLERTMMKMIIIIV